MIRDINDLAPDVVLQAEIAIVGAGFAGIDLARHFGRHGAKVIVLESGRYEFDSEIQKLARAESIGKVLRTPDPHSKFWQYLAPIFRGESRIRQFGGTSNIWTGKWRTFDHLDFSKRSWIPFSGWPISREDLQPFYREVMLDYGLGDQDEFARSHAFTQAKEKLAAAGVKVSFHYWEREAFRPASRFRDELANTSTVEVLLGANATEIVLDDDLQRVKSIVFHSLDGRRFTLNAAYFVLSMGGLECARLLLCSNRQIPEGIGNAKGLVGRFHMDHPKSKRGKLWPGPATRTISEWTKTQFRPCFHISLSLPDKVQQEQQVLDHALYLSPVYRYQMDYPRETVDRLKQAIRTAMLPQAALAAWRLISSPRSLWKVLQRWWHGNKGGNIAYYDVLMYVEQAPNPESRLSLGRTQDSLGIPMLVIDWRLCELDHEAFERMIKCLVKTLHTAELGRLDFGQEPFSLNDTVDAAHHMGATRMAATPDTGVVDSNCKVFGLSNLFIASSSVFPTGHSAAPTMTILALCRRLVGHVLTLRQHKRN